MFAFVKSGIGIDISLSATNDWTLRTTKSVADLIYFEKSVRTEPMPQRLGDDIDDFCIKCKRLTNHSIVSLVEEKAAKVRCRTCYHDHDFRNEEPLPSKKELKKAALLEEALKNGGGVAAAVLGDLDSGEEEDPELAESEGADGDEGGETVQAAASPKAKKAAAKKTAKKK